MGDVLQWGNNACARTLFYHEYYYSCWCLFWSRQVHAQPRGGVGYQPFINNVAVNKVAVRSIVRDRPEKCFPHFQQAVVCSMQYHAEKGNPVRKRLGVTRTLRDALSFHGNRSTRGSINTGIHRRGNPSTQGSINTGIHQHRDQLLFLFLSDCPGFLLVGFCCCCCCCCFWGVLFFSSVSSLPPPPLPPTRSGELRTQKLKSHLVRTQNWKVLPLKPGVGQHIAIHATLTARDFFLA